MSGVFREAMPPDLYRRYARIAIARDTGWTLEIIDGLGVRDLLDYMAVVHGLNDIAAFFRDSSVR